MTRIFSMYTGETMTSPVDHRGRYYDLILAGFKLAKRGDVFELKPTKDVVEQYDINMPPMDTLFAVVDPPDKTRLCGLKAYRDHEDYCSCMGDTPDARRCKHLWAADFFVFRSGTYLSKAVELHENFLDGRYPELRRFEPVFVGRNTDADLEGLGVFVLLSHSVAFLDLFDHFGSRSEIYHALRTVVDTVLKGDRVSFKRMSSALRNHDVLRFILGKHDAGRLLQSVLEFFDQRLKKPYFYSLLRWKSETHTVCSFCKHEATLEDMEGWKHLVVPTKTPGEAPSSIDKTATLFQHLNDSKTEYMRLHCKNCASYDFHKVEHVPVSSGKLHLMDLHQHPRREHAADVTIPVSFTDFNGDGYFLVGFLCKDADARTARGYTVVQYRQGAFWEGVSHGEVPFTLGSNPSRIPSLVLYERVNAGSVAASPTSPVFPRSVVHTQYPTVPLALATPRAANGTRRLSV